MSSTTASLRYFSPPADGSRLYTYLDVDSITGERSRNWTEDSHTVVIENVRGSEAHYTLDTAGFQYGKQPSVHTRFVDENEIQAEYYPECVDLIKKVTGASSAVIYDHTLRCHRFRGIHEGVGRRPPVVIVHADQTTASSITLVHRHLPSDAPALLKRRFQIINLWRPISHAAFNWPLALCDFRSIDVKKDLLLVTLVYPDREQESFGVKFNEAHRWKYLKGMEPDEYVLIKCFDSKQEEGVATLAPHTGFQDPNSPEGAPLRESIEVRALVFYD